MSFVITARTILHLGSDLISSDGVAIYELIKNAIDAKSKTGIDIRFDIVIRESDFASCMTLLENEEDASLDEVKNAFRSKVKSEAEDDLKDEFLRAIRTARTRGELKQKARAAYKTTSRIVFTDTGSGMSRRDLRDIYLTIGTTHRARAVRDALNTDEESPPYLGEKGVGRLSVMRLGWRVRIETGTVEDTETSVLEIDWRKFEEADDAEASSVRIAPTRGRPKEIGTSGTVITVSDLRSSWSIQRLQQIARDEISRMSDPFSWEQRRRFRVRISMNGVSVSSPRDVAAELLKEAHAKCVGEYVVEDAETGKPSLKATIESKLYSGDSRVFTFDLTDLMSLSGLAENGQPWTVLKSLGGFKFELYWFNRQRLKAIPELGDRNEVRALVKAWTGICLFRDGYRVLPYGGEGDDWLNLDMEALSASGYKLNTKQIIGRVTIGRLSNPKLIDQTNRQGLIESPEKEALISILHELISAWWHDYLNEAIRTQKKLVELAYDPVGESTVVETLEERATNSIREIRRNYTGEARLLAEVKDAFLEIKEAHRRAVERIGAIEEEKERLTQLAGIGLLVEMIAHELARATELTQATLKDLSRRDLGGDASAALKTLGSQVKVIQKRLLALEPLAISARFRRSQQRLAPILTYVLDGHTAQFGPARHDIAVSIDPRSDLETVAFIIEGHFVQIIENLISNSVYWLDLHKKEHPSFEPEIVVTILSDPPRIQYFDNGPGIPKNRAESIFEPFFSTKKGNVARRRGLGLYIARQNAESMGGALNLIKMGRPHENRYNTFELVLKERADES
ncbi:ATP-binding protein [Burkholderia gladioli]|uniref:ATP-binding protein n=1 Tax=Burkholderia gladioli TaxID=28095 RepID=UPI001C24ED48|nr:ATP-binding protein [Burkholderia gladioli]MBU9169586.1 ATP-binding protein [Burkholderia gladioli]